MACTPTLPCGSCQECEDCVESTNCADINYLDTGCAETHDLKCIVYSGDNLSCLEVLQDDSVQTIVEKINTKICAMDIPISITNTDHTISIVQSGYQNHTNIINTVLSATSGNILAKNSDGLYATDTTLVATDTATIDFTTSGTKSHLLTASVKLSANTGNMISAETDGLFMRLLLTTTGSSGASTLVGSTLNVPTYTLVGLGGVPTTRLITINGSAQDLSADRTWTVAVTGTANRITVSGGSGLTPTIDIASTYVGQTSLTTLGTITTGTWTATPIANAYIANSSITVTAGTGLSGGGTVALGGTIILTNTITQYTDALARVAVSLTTTGSSGAATYSSSTGVFNIPNYTAAGLGAVPTTRLITINGTAQDLSADRTWNVGTVTSVDGTAGAGISISGGSITTSGALTITNTGVLSNVAGTGISVSGATGNVTITNTAPDQIVVLSNGTGISVTGTYPNFTIATTITQYTDALARAAISLTTTGSSGASTYNSTSGVLNVPTYTLSGLGGVATTRSLTINGSAQDLSSDRTWTITVTGTTNRVSVTGGTGLTPTIDISSAYVGQATITTLGTITTGVWNGTAIANANLANSSITVTAGTGMSGGGLVSLGGTITLNSTITQYTDALARAAISLTVTGSSGASTYNSTSGVLNVPTYTLTGLGGVPTGRTLTINGSAFDLSADRSWSVGTVTSVGATAGTGISIGGSPVTTSGSITITNTEPDQTVVLTNGAGISITGTYPNFTIATTITQYTDVMARAAISLTTVGSSGVATYNSSTGVLNIPSYAAGTGTVTSVDLTAGTGISVGGGPVTTSGSITVTNTAPDQTVVLNNGASISVTGTYPNFTIANTAPDQIVSITNGGGITVSGTYPNFTLTSLYTVSGSTNRVAKFTGTNSVGDSLIYNSATKVSVNYSGTSEGPSTFNVLGTSHFDFTETFVSGPSYSAGYTYTPTYTGSLPTSNASYSVVPLEFHPILNGATTVGSDNQFGALLANNMSKFSSTGTLTLSGSNASAAIHSGTWDDGTINGTITRSAGIVINGIARVPAATATITRTNHFALLINDITGQYSTGTVTNKYGIYQVGTGDKNVFFGEIEYHGALTNASDLRSKNKGDAFTKGLDIIDQVNPTFFTKKEGFGKTDINHVGIIAQELEAVLPEAIKIGICNDIEDFRFYDPSVLMYTMLNAIKELSAKVKVLEAK